jgi:hypothetical protein
MKIKTPILMMTTAIFAFLILAADVQASVVSQELGTASGITNPVIVDPDTGAWAEQVNIRTASNGAGSLVVWSERDASGIGDIRGARLDVAGNVLDPDGFPIFTGPGDQRVPDVVWDGQSYFVVWESRAIDSGDIYGVHVSADGVVDTNVVTIAVGWAQQGYPSVGFDGTQYLVAWHGYAATPAPSTEGIWATSVTSDGVVQTPGGFLLVDAPNGQAYPDIAYAPASQTYLVVWGDHRRTAPIPGYPDSFEWPPYDIYGARLQIDANGTPTFLDLPTASLAIHVGEQCDRRPRITSDGTNFLVVGSCVNGLETWDGTTVRMSAIAHRVSAGGTVSAAIDVSGGIGDAWGVNVAYTEPNYFVTWVNGATAPPQLLANRVSPAGSVVGGSAALVALDPRFMLEAPPPDGRLLFTSHISVNKSRTGEALVGYTREQTPGGTTRVRARLVDVEHIAVTFTITATAGPNGSITPSGDLTVPGGGNAAFTIAPDPGYKINYVAVNGASVGAVPGYTFTNVQQNYTIRADFVPATYKITVTAGANGAITPGTYSGFQPGANQTYTIKPNTGYTVSDVLVDGSSVGAVASYPFTNIQSDHTISAAFAQNPTYTITATAGTGGSINPGSTTLLAGQGQKFTITAASDYRINAVTVDGVNKGAIGSYTFSGVTADHTIVASFVPDIYTITASVLGGSGSISPAGVTQLFGGGNQTYTITPNAGYKINYVAVNGASVGAVTSYTFSNVRQNYTIKADFVPITYKITVTQGANGTVTPGTYSGFKPGSSQTYRIIPNAGYQVTDVIVDNIPVGVMTSYTFTNIQANHRITATFAPNP